MILPAHLAGVAERDIALQVLQMLVDAHAMPADERQMNRQCSRPPASSAPFLADALRRDALIRKIEQAGSVERRPGVENLNEVPTQLRRSGRLSVPR